MHSSFINPGFDVMQTKKLRKLVESSLGWTVEEDAEIDEDDEVSIMHLHHHLFLFTSASMSILVQGIFVCMRFV